MLPYNKRLRRYSRELRKNMTEAEANGPGARMDRSRLLWSRIRRKQLKGYPFYRQKIIGNYIVDFCCPKANLVVELDGGQHYGDEGVRKDRPRDAYMAHLGLRVLQRDI